MDLANITDVANPQHPQLTEQEAALLVLPAVPKTIEECNEIKALVNSRLQNIMKIGDEATKAALEASPMYQCMMIQNEIDKRGTPATQEEREKIRMLNEQVTAGLLKVLPQSSAASSLIQQLELVKQKAIQSNSSTAQAQMSPTPLGPSGLKESDVKFVIGGEEKSEEGGLTIFDKPSDPQSSMTLENVLKRADGGEDLDDEEDIDGSFVSDEEWDEELSEYTSDESELDGFETAARLTAAPKTTTESAELGEHPAAKLQYLPGCSPEELQKCRPTSAEIKLLMRGTGNSTLTQSTGDLNDEAVGIDETKRRNSAKYTATTAWEDFVYYEADERRPIMRIDQEIGADKRRPKKTLPPLDDVTPLLPEPPKKPIEIKDWSLKEQSRTRLQKLFSCVFACLQPCFK